MEEQQAETRTYSQWVAVTLCSEGATIYIKNAKHAYGKFYKSGDKDTEIEPSTINTYSVKSGEHVYVNACGRSGAAMGTGGSFEVWDNSGLICTYYWDCPHGSAANKSYFEISNNAYNVDFVSGHLDKGAIGEVGLVVITKEVITSKN